MLILKGQCPLGGDSWLSPPVTLPRHGARAIPIFCLQKYHFGGDLGFFRCLYMVGLTPAWSPPAPGSLAAVVASSWRRGVAQQLVGSRSSQGRGSQASSGSVPAAVRASGSISAPRSGVGQEGRPVTDWAPGKSKLETSSITAARRGCGSVPGSGGGRLARDPGCRALHQPCLPSRSRGHLMTLITRSMAVFKAISANHLWKCSRWGTERRKGLGGRCFFPPFFPSLCLMLSIRDPLPLLS